MIAVVDYGVGNVQAFLNLFKRIDILAKRAQRISDLNDATHFILPGVGHFDHAMKRFNASGLRDGLERLVFDEKLPILGVCVGMQMLASSSDEGVEPGLGWVPGCVRAFSSDPRSEHLPMPHMGWNTLDFDFNSKLFINSTGEKMQFYFLHSYFFDCDDRSNVSASSFYGFNFDSVVSRGHIHGIQCHPEKSHHWGEKFLKNFSSL